MSKTYKLTTINDLRHVPIGLRFECAQYLLRCVEIAELRGVDVVMPINWAPGASDPWTVTAAEDAAPARAWTDSPAARALLDAADAALKDLGACDDPACTVPQFLHVRARIAAALRAFAPINT